MLCVPADELVSFVSGALPDDRYEAVLAHVDECSACRTALGDLATGTPLELDATAVSSNFGVPLLRSNSAATPGTRISRYVVVRVIGEGGMGVVTLARDPELRRKVVIKLVRPDIQSDASIRTRLLVEAQAMARVSHENVVPIYDVGTLGDQVFIAMEYIEGTNLAQWLAVQPRTHAEILSVFRAAGRGLAAAHAAKLIHRDFKPHNVLIGASGVVKVTDFGLACAFDATTAGPGASGSTNFAIDGLTRTGTLVGTPAYMAPEQIVADEVDHRADQFAFCVALYHALFGVRPFDGTSMDTIYDAILSGRLATSKARVEPRIRAALVRGLAANPADRFPSMTELLAAIAPRRRVLPIAIGGTAALALVGVVLATRGSSEPSAAPLCDAAPLAEIWNPARSAALLHVAQPLGAGPLAGDIAKDLDDYTRAWTAMAQENCTLTKLHHTQPEAIRLRRESCLDAARADLARAVDEVVYAADLEHLQVAQHSVHAVRDLARCTEPGFGFTLVPHHPASLRAVLGVRKELVLATVAQSAFKFDEAGALLDKAALSTRSLHYPPIEAEVQLARGRLAILQDHPDLATTLLTDAVQLADLGHHDEAKGEAQLALAELATLQNKPDQAKRYRQAAISSLHDASSLAKAELASARSLAAVLERRGQIDDALREHDRAIAAAAAVFGDPSPEFADAVHKKATALKNDERYLPAIELYIRLRELYARLPTTTPDLAAIVSAGYTVTDIGMLDCLANLHRFTEALALADKMIARGGQAVVMARIHTARLYADRGDATHALAAIDAAIADVEWLGPTSLIWINVRIVRSNVLDRLGRFADAEKAIRQARLSPTASVGTQVTYANALATALVHQHKSTEASAILERNVTALEGAPQQDLGHLRNTLSRLAHAYVDAKLWTKAIAVADRGLAIETTTNGDDVAMLRFAKGRALTDGKVDAEAGRALVKQARDYYERTADVRRLRELDAWLATLE